MPEFARTPGVRGDGRWHPNLSQYSQPAVDDPSAAAFVGAPPDLRRWEFTPDDLRGELSQGRPEWRAGEWQLGMTHGAIPA